MVVKKRTLEEQEPEHQLAWASPKKLAADKGRYYSYLYQQEVVFIETVIMLTVVNTNRL